MSNNPDIYHWLSNLPDFYRVDRSETTIINPNLKRPRELEMTTPPSSAARTGSLSPGPKKRKIDDSRPDSDEPDPDPDATPRSGRAQRPATTLSMRIAFPPPSSLSHSSAASIVSDRQDRSSKALYPGRPPPDSVYRKPEGGNDKDGMGQDEERFFDYLPLSALFAGTAEGASFQARIAHAEFYKVRSIKDHARECLALRRAEAAWNAKVHEPLLELALSRRHTSVICENATSARILPCFLPCLITGEVAEGKMVDFVLAPDLGSESELDIAIQNKLVELAKQMKSSGLVSAQLCINQTDYPPLTRSPAAVTIETKVTGASLEEGRLQLGVWIAAWHSRMEMLGVGGGKPGPQLPTLPLVLTHDHVWSLYFAVDRLDKIEVFGPMHIGMTDNLPNIYQLLTVLRLLGAWIDTTFRSWVINAFRPQT
ncbi:hypothetical protein MYCTH_116679 [Thermothelomyces thermophilus ATCC 42464]|uniref:PD-(D/E)XK nuclease-like domain-containing protein n=1 Tax=Thermothelomyces thermophilus (strain ATCC 42464 / BCRC 31852 / DSM 1799) TaxID=573729 RepID=G2QID3_THET4|nr:uncharacterized protein MYCTH_116679 [Thermothelomyces thermophilus ATCC 42464]AEO60307.1 hypothetical protein MYCTH_116679 [Thermothelomyces thermophilus ATCC 42464]